MIMGRKPLHLDGTTLEGGGQLLRIAVGLSALTGVAVHITDIRGKRRGSGGLKLQHLTAVKWLADACGAETEGAEPKSKSLTFSPGYKNPGMKPEKRNYIIDISTPGAATLVFQAILPFLLFSRLSHEAIVDTEARNEIVPITVTILGGTNVTNSPSVDYVAQVLLPTLKSLGFPAISQRVHSRGWSTGRVEMGKVTYSVKPFQLGQALPSFDLIDRGEVERVQATIIAPRTMEADFRQLLKSVPNEGCFAGADLDLDFQPSGHDRRIYLLLVAHTNTGRRIGRDLLWVHKVSSLGTTAKQMVKSVVKDLRRELEHGGCVDEYLRDQLVVFQALAHGRSRVAGGHAEKVEMSLHAQTAWWVVNEILGVSREETILLDEATGAAFVDDGRFSKRTLSGMGVANLASPS